MARFDFDLGAALARAKPGAVAAGRLFALNHTQPLRVTYNWKYSSLNIDPRDSSYFGWVLDVIDNNTISLSPQEQYRNKTLYASVRPDIDYRVQVQAPYSAQWIIRVGADEKITRVPGDLLYMSLKGVNGKYILVDDTQTSHDGHSGYLLHSSAENNQSDAAKFFLAASEILQPGLDIPLADTFDRDTLMAALAAAGASAPLELAEAITRRG